MSTLRKCYIDYLADVKINLTDYLLLYISEFDFLFELYKVEKYCIVYFDKPNKLIRFCFYFDSKKPSILFRDKMLKNGTGTLFLPNKIIIQKKLTPLDISVCAAIHDFSEIKEEIQKAELQRMVNTTL